MIDEPAVYHGQDLMGEHRLRKAFLLFLVFGMTAALLWVLWSFVLTILMAALLTGLVRPLYTQINQAFGGRRAAASGMTMILLLVLVIAPLMALVGVVVNQAIRVAGNVGPVVERLANEPFYLDQQLQRIPGFDYFNPYREQIVTRAGDLVGAASGFLVESLSDTTRGTVSFVFHFFILLYTMFFMLMDGPSMLRTILTYLPLRDGEKTLMMDRFTSVTRATVKGTIVIGIIQGSLSGLAFWVIGIPAALFWTVIMIVLSIVPVIGGMLVWIPAALILLGTGEVGRAVFLVLFCGLVVGSIDNILRPRLVGRDTKMHDLMILFSTLGGIIAFGPVGFIVGPVLAGLFVTSWEIFAVAFRNDLAEGSVSLLLPGGEPPARSGGRAAEVTRSEPVTEPASPPSHR
jgi:predicted PurR-regulated permease PerM